MFSAGSSQMKFRMTERDDKMSPRGKTALEVSWRAGRWPTCETGQIRCLAPGVVSVAPVGVRPATSGSTDSVTFGTAADWKDHLTVASPDVPNQSQALFLVSFFLVIQLF